MYKSVTRGISVTVTPRFVEEGSPPARAGTSSPTRSRSPTNGRAGATRARYWRIIDGKGEVQEVRGEGVVGKQPVLRPGECFNYTSGCPLATPDGSDGTASTPWQDENGAIFEAESAGLPARSPRM